MKIKDLSKEDQKRLKFIKTLINNMEINWKIIITMKGINSDVAKKQSDEIIKSKKALTELERKYDLKLTYDLDI